jgi:hypothetical protein
METHDHTALAWGDKGHTSMDSVCESVSTPRTVPSALITCNRIMSTERQDLAAAHAMPCVAAHSTSSEAAQQMYYCRTELPQDCELESQLLPRKFQSELRAQPPPGTGTKRGNGRFFKWIQAARLLRLPQLHGRAGLLREGGQRLGRDLAAVDAAAVLLVDAAHAGGHLAGRNRIGITAAAMAELSMAQASAALPS